MAQNLFEPQRFFFRNAAGCNVGPQVGCFMYYQLDSSSRLVSDNLAEPGYYSDGFDIFRVDSNGQIDEINSECVETPPGGGGGGTVTWNLVSLYYSSTESGVCLPTARTVDVYINATTLNEATELARNEDGTNPPGGGFYGVEDPNFGRYYREWVLRLDGNNSFRSDGICDNGGEF